MVITAAPAPDLNLVENNDCSAQVKAADARIDFAALLFFVPGIPPIQNSIAEGESQATTNLNALIGLTPAIANAPGQVVSGEIAFDPTAGQPAPMESQNQVNDDGVAPSLQQSLAAILIPVNGVQPITDSAALSAVSSLVSSEEKPAIARPIVSPLITPSLSSGQPQIALQDG